MSISDVNVGLGYAGSYGIFIPKPCDHNDVCKLFTTLNAFSLVPGLGVVTGGMKLKIWYNLQKKANLENPSDDQENMQRKLRIGLVVAAIFEILGLGLLTLPVHIYASVLRYQRYTRPEKESHPKANLHPCKVSDA